MVETNLSVNKIKELYSLANDLRNNVVDMVTLAGSGHLGGSYSEAEILSVLYNHEMKFDPHNPTWSERDRFVLSKGHANPGLYAILGEKGFFSKEEFKSLRKLDGLLQGHPERIVPGVEYIAGFLGQGLSAGCGMALGFKKENRENRVYVLIGDGDNLEGQTWEAARFAVHNGLDNLVAIFDYNNILSDDITDNVLSIKDPEKQWSSFGWNVIIIDGHDVIQISKALKIARNTKEIPTIIVAHTKKGHGVSIWENNVRSHGGGYQITKEEYEITKRELRENKKRIDSMDFFQNKDLSIIEPMILLNQQRKKYSGQIRNSCNFEDYTFNIGEKIGIRNAFGPSAANLAKKFNDFDIFDADLKGGTSTDTFEKHFPDRFIQCGIAEQNMFSMAAGYHLATDRIPVVTTFAVFASMLGAAQFRNGVALQKLPYIVVASHLGVDVGQDGPTHQAIEDIGIFASYPGVQILSPCDANRVQSVFEAALKSRKPTYLRTGRSPVPVIYSTDDKYSIGHDTVIQEGNDITIFATNRMVHKALDTYKILKKENISTEIIDITSINPLDKETILKSIKKTNCAVTVEDHYVKNGMGVRISQLIASEYPVIVKNLGVEMYGRTGSSEELTIKHGLEVTDIMKLVKETIQKK